METQLAPVKNAKEVLAISLSAASPPRWGVDLDSLANSLQLPIPLGQSFLTWAANNLSSSTMPISRETFDRLDSSRPMTVVWLSRGTGAPLGWCSVLSFKTDQLARQTLDEMGTAIRFSDGIYERRGSAGNVFWAGIKGPDVLFANAPGTLMEGGAIALAEQAAPMSGLVVATFFPEVMAKATGKPLDALVQSGVAGAVAEMEKSAAATPGAKELTPATRKMLTALLTVGSRPIIDVTQARVRLQLGPQQGLMVSAELQPKPGSGFAEQWAHIPSYALDPDLPITSDATAVTSWGDMASSVPLWKEVLAASGPAGEAASHSFESLFGQTLAGGSCVVDLSAVPVSSLCSIALRSGVTPARATERFQAMLEASNAWEAELDGRKPTPLRIKRSGKIIDVQKKLEHRDPATRDVLKAMFGGDAMLTAITVRDGRLIQAVGAKPRAVLARYHHGKGDVASAAPILSHTLSDTSGAAAMSSLDVASVLAKVLKNSRDPSAQQALAMASTVPGLLDLRAPFVFVGRGGATPTVQFQIPFGTLDNIAKVVRGAMGAGGGAPPPQK